MLYPLVFHPIFKERIWGGRNLEVLFGKRLPEQQLIGESWEVTDRPEGISVIAQGPLAGKDLRWVMENRLEELMGQAHAPNGKFPLLVKILDAQEKLSVQVHPPASVAELLGGEPKTELWYIAEAAPGAELFVGLRRGVGREEFARRVEKGTVAESIHRVSVHSGDVMFLPSGRVHAIGSGNVIFEIQQNSDTTYRVFDWNRVDAEGKPRQLHVEQSLESIDFEDFEPALVNAGWCGEGVQTRVLAADPLFEILEGRYLRDGNKELRFEKPMVLGVIEGEIQVVWDGLEADSDGLRLGPGRFCLVPACLERCEIRGLKGAHYLQAMPG